MHPGMFLLAITFNSLPRCVEKLNSCIFAVYILAIQSKCREYHWFMFSQVSCFFMPGKMSSETRQMLCAFKLCEKKEETPKPVIRPKQIPQATCQYSHLQHKSSKACFRGFTVHLFVLNKTGGGILKKYTKNTPGSQQKEGFLYVQCN